MDRPGERQPTRRFSDRVGYYVRYRPGYPSALFGFLRDELGLTRESAIADIGSGTGTLSRRLVETGHAVYAVEPNREMRAAAEALLREYPGFRSIEGSAEATGLAAHSLDFILAAQAFHWFRIDETRAEFSRVLKPSGRVVLIWNRRTEATSFLRAYEELLRRMGNDYCAVDHRKTTDSGVLSEFFGPQDFGRTSFPNEQVLDWTGLRGRALSSSYVPLQRQPGHDEMMRELRAIFDRNQRGGRVRFAYSTEVFWGSPGK